MTKKDKYFGKIYSKYYDLLYMDKDYEKECDFIEEIFRSYSAFKPVKILDAGCGTGGHLIPLAKRGYRLVGIDKSKEMVKIAQEKIKKEKLNLNAKVFVGDIINFDLNMKFDACICMFAVINYITETDDLIRALKNIRKHLKRNALFVFDTWYGPAVLTIRPETRIKVVEREDLKIIRIVTPELDTFNHIQRSNYYLIAIKNSKIIDEVNEVHVVRYLFPQELIHYLNEAGFRVLKICEFLHLDRPPRENTWNVTVITNAI